MKLFLVRHGETDANLNGIAQGWLDLDLNERGLQQAQEAGAAFNESIDAIFSSDLKRASQTAQVFRDKFSDVPYQEDERLRERNFGEVTGRPLSDVDWDGFWAVPDDQVPLPGAESLDQFNQRVQNFIDGLKLTTYARVLIVAHSGTINRFRHLINNDDHAVHANASVTQMTLK